MYKGSIHDNQAALNMIMTVIAHTGGCVSAGIKNVTGIGKWQLQAPQKRGNDDSQGVSLVLGEMWVL